MKDGKKIVLSVLSTWGNILQGRKPILSIEITRECPLRCPGCYAYDPVHLGDAGPLRDLSDYKGEALTDAVMVLVRRSRPAFLSIVGGEPLVRYRELDVLLPKLEEMGVEVQLVTSAVRPIPTGWRELTNLHLVVSIDGLQPEHDRRRSPATYERILKHIAGQRLIVHCTITSQFLKRADYLKDFTAFWAAREEVLKIWFSLYTPQEGEQSPERLSPEERTMAVREIAHLCNWCDKVDVSKGVLQAYLHPPASPEECLFAQVTECVSADLSTPVNPCQLGGRPVCSECGCMASAALATIGRYKVAGLIPVTEIYGFSHRLGRRLSRTDSCPRHGRLRT